MTDGIFSMLTARTAIVHAAGGAIGRAVATSFAGAGATVHLTGRSRDKLDETATALGSALGSVEQLDLLDADAVAAHTDAVAGRGGIDVVFNAYGDYAVQGTPLSELKVADFSQPFDTWLRAQLISSQAAARHMVPRGSGVILTLSASPASLAIGGTGGFGAACAAVEAMTRTLAAEVGPSGVRAVCLRPHRIVETLRQADFPDVELGEFTTFLKDMTLLKRLPTLADVAAAATFAASDGGAAMTGSVLNLTAGVATV